MKGKLLLTGILSFAAGVFVCKNKWCQEKIAKAKEKGEEYLNKRKCQCQTEEQPSEE